MTEQMTDQEVFNTVWDHFVTNKGPASMSVEGSECLYRGQNGAKCAFGIFIPDELYSTSLEHKGVKTLITLAGEHGSAFPAWVSAFSPAFSAWVLSFTADRADLLCKLQAAHDAAAVAGGSSEDFTRIFRHRLIRLAAAFVLTVPTTEEDNY